MALCEKCSPLELKAMRALESLTPSGSEFVNEVERCTAFIRGAIDAQWEYLKKKVIECKWLAKENALLKQKVADLEEQLGKK
jgi:hypothetical protein